jgi:hypothetical protein
MITRRNNKRDNRVQKRRIQPSEAQTSAKKQNQSNAPWHNHPAYRLWIREFFHALFDFEFQQSVTVKMLPLLYVVGIIASGMLALYCISTAFLSSIWHGIGFLLVLGPLIFIFCTAALRSTLEFFSVVFRIQHNMHQLLGALSDMRQELRGMQQDMSELAKAVHEVAIQAGDIASTVNEAKVVIGELEGLTDRIPFFRKPKKAERQKNWAEAPLSDQYDRPKNKQDRNAKKTLVRPPNPRDLPAESTGESKPAPQHATRPSTLVELGGDRKGPGAEARAKTLNFRAKKTHSTRATDPAPQSSPKTAQKQTNSNPQSQPTTSDSATRPNKTPKSGAKFLGFNPSQDQAANKPEMTD